MPQYQSRLFGENDEPPHDTPAAATPVDQLLPRGARHLWLCCRLPALPLEVLRGFSRPLRAVIVERGQRTSILIASAPAAALGIHAGMPLAAALALAPGIEFKPRQSSREAAALRRLAAWAGKFSPTISIDPGGALLLEVRGSQRYFGGLERLRESVLQGLHDHGHEVISAVAPTALAALWLTCAGLQTVIRERGALARSLRHVPVQDLGWPERTCSLLAQFGVRTLGECLRLPRQGLARRLGPAWLRELDQCLGVLPEVRLAYQSPESFCASLELSTETAEAAVLLAAFGCLLQQLGERLQVRQATVRVLWCGFMQRGHADSWWRIGLRQPSGDPERLLALLRERLDAARLERMVDGIALQTWLADGADGGDEDLFGDVADGDRRLSALIDSLRTRLGDAAVHGIAEVADHRPERAWRQVAELPPRYGDAAPARAAAASRPPWLLPAPQPLRVTAGHPVHGGGPLVLEAGPERIESGWWDGADVRRDYYVASDRRGARLWVFRDLRSGGWYLHGIFG